MACSRQRQQCVTKKKTPALILLLLLLHLGNLYVSNLVHFIYAEQVKHVWVTVSVTKSLCSDT